MIREYSIGVPKVFAAYDAKSRNVGDLLSDNMQGRVVIPKFQRGYSWQKKHVEAFWKDIRRFQKEKPQKGTADRYFLGPIVVMAGDDSVLFILDGQQRLATATILFSVLRDAAAELNTTEAALVVAEIQNHLISKEDYGFCIEMGALDRHFFEETIQKNPPLKTKPKLKSHRNIRQARETLYKELKTALSADPTQALKEINDLRKLVRSDLVMAAIEVTSQREAFQIFETLNDRGLQLSVPDLLLNYLMGVAVDDTERDKIRAYWDQMIQGMGRKDISQFLRHIWVSKYGDLKNQDLFTALKEHIEVNGIKSIDFAQTCSTECDKYVELVNADKNALGVARRYVESLVAKLGFEVTLPLLLSVHSKAGNQDLAQVCRWLLVFVARRSILLGLDSSVTETTLFTLARVVRALAIKEMLAHIKDALVLKAPTDEQLMAIKVDGEELQFDREDAIYLVSRLAEFKMTKTHEKSLAKATLEHVFPQNPSADWTDEEKEELEPYLWHLGNLTYIGTKMNGSIGNAGYAAKRPYYEKSTELEITRDIAKNFQTWDRAAIVKRAESLLPDIIKIWNFTNPSHV